ncbi:MAG: type IV pilus secretin PilQ [Gammaproteobacteria bacterium]|nr:type IV pilus secretin PilQ [Gammaproteobacteria bacterium]MDP6616942.1 type IV pilus secretin PilQ [Gammaproteobacteria bacterium]MDP6694632.1 type IV pilus secretin PilQ [Gammaproteobacteria bacterium]
MASISVSAQEASNKLQDIEIQNLPGDKVELRLVLSGPAPEPLSFTIDQPARIALDLADTSLGLDSRRTDVGVGALDTVLAAEANGRTRIVLNLDSLVDYETRVVGNTVLVTLAAPTSGQPVVTDFAAAAASVASTGERSIDSIDFRRTESGGGRVIVELSDAGTPVDVRQEGGRVVVNFGGTNLPDELLQRLDVLDFATPVSTIDVVRVDSDARLIISAKGAYEELAYQSENLFTVEIQPVEEEEGPKLATLYSGGKEYVGDRLTLNFQDIDARAVLQLLADISGRNIVVSDTVAGNVTLRLQNVPWDQAMDIVLATKGLDMRENGNVIIVAPAEEIAAREKADLESRQEIKELEPLFSEFLQVNYAKASDIARLIGEGGENSLLGQRGTVAIDDRTNTLLLKDTADHINDIRRLVARLDIPVRQVLIESRIVVVNDDFSRDLGIRWGFTGVDDNGDNGLIAVSGSAAGTGTITDGAFTDIQNGTALFPVNMPSLDDRFNVNLPVANPAGSFALAILDDDYLIDLELSAVQAEGNGEVISSPRVITANQKEAKIEQGVEIPYQEASSSGATTTQFKDAVLSLTVTPQITPDDRIIMDLVVTKDSVGDQVSDSFGGTIPSIDTRSVTTQVLVDNGQTVVLGGIYETERTDVVTKVPFLGDIPGIGAIFRNTRKVSNKSELLVFVTPKILKEGSTIY